MGNNSAFTEFEATIIAVYDEGVLSQRLCRKLIEIYDGTDIDEGGMVGTLSTYGLNVKEIVIKVLGILPTYPTEKQGKAYDEYQDKISDAFSEITSSWYK